MTPQRVAFFKSNCIYINLIFLVVAFLLFENSLFSKSLLPLIIWNIYVFFYCAYNQWSLVCQHILNELLLSLLCLIHKYSHNFKWKAGKVHSDFHDFHSSSAIVLLIMKYTTWNKMTNLKIKTFLSTKWVVLKGKAGCRALFISWNFIHIWLVASANSAENSPAKWHNDACVLLGVNELESSISLMASRQVMHPHARYFWRSLPSATPFLFSVEHINSWRTTKCIEDSRPSWRATPRIYGMGSY